MFGCIYNILPLSDIRDTSYIYCFGYR